MKIKWYKWGGLFYWPTVLILVVLSGFCGWVIAGNDQTSYQLQIKALQGELAVCEKNYEQALAFIPDADEAGDWGEEWLREILDNVLSNVVSANITYEYNSDGYSRGFLSFYYEGGEHWEFMWDDALWEDNLHLSDFWENRWSEGLD